MSKNLVIGVCGKQGSGKDTVAIHLVENYNFKQLSLARYIKELAGNVFGFSEKQLWGPSSNREEEISIDWELSRKRLNDYGPEWLGFLKSSDKMPQLIEAFDYLHIHFAQKMSARVALQYLGTEFGRQQLHLNVWVDALIYEAELAFKRGECSGIVVSDVRFVNEMQAIHGAKGKVFKLMRNANQVGTGIAGHASEKEQESIPMENFDFILNNQGTLPELFEAVDMYMRCHSGDV